jgi:uncharacterized protein RhaS with RHS repeats
MPVRIEASGGAVQELSYDSRGDIVQVAGPLDRRMERAFDARRSVVTERHPGGGVSVHRYVGEARVETVLPDGLRLRYGYDAMLRLAWIENAAGQVVRREHDGGAEAKIQRDERGFARRAERYRDPPPSAAGRDQR